MGVAYIITLNKKQDFIKQYFNFASLITGQNNKKVLSTQENWH